MNLYRFECVVFVRANTPEEAAQHLADEVEYHFSLDNDLVSLTAGEPELYEEGDLEDDLPDELNP